MIWIVSRYSKPATWVVLVGSTSMYLLVTICVYAGPAMSDCPGDMGMEEPAGVEVRSNSDCCFSCVTHLGVTAPTVLGPTAVAPLPATTIEVLPSTGTASRFLEQHSPSPTGSPPFFILNSAFLI